MKTTTALVAATLALSAVGYVTMFTPVHAQECVSIEQDKINVERDGKVKYLGVKRIPYTEEGGVFYVAPNGITVVSPIIDGCVMSQVFPAGKYRAEVGA